MYLLESSWTACCWFSLRPKGRGDFTSECLRLPKLRGVCLTQNWKLLSFRTLKIFQDQKHSLTVNVCCLFTLRYCRDAGIFFFLFLLLLLREFIQKPCDCKCVCMYLVVFLYPVALKSMFICRWFWKELYDDEIYWSVRVFLSKSLQHLFIKDVWTSSDPWLYTGGNMFSRICVFDSWGSVQTCIFMSCQVSVKVNK